MAELRFEGRTALVTGSGRGLGLAYAELLAKRGAKVVLNARTAQSLEAAARKIRAAGGAVAVAPGDLSSEEGCKAVAGQALDAFGAPDILINNAGVSRRLAFEDITGADYREILALNLDSTFFMIRETWPHMKARGYGRIVNTGSGAGMFGTRDHALYGMAKAAVQGLTRVLAIDAAQVGITVNAITPLAATRLANNIQDESLKRDFFGTLPPERCAPLVCWLAHESCGVNGETLDVGGGMVSRIFIGLTEGYLNPDMAIEDVSANAAAIFDETGYSVPREGEGRAAALIGKVREWNEARGRA